MRKSIIRDILSEKTMTPQQSMASTFAPANIALCKYWGKRNYLLNLPITSSLSISLGKKGAQAKLSIASKKNHEITINDKPIDKEASYATALLNFLNDFSMMNHHYHLSLQTNIPVASGLASSAAIYAAVVKAIDALFNWQLSGTYLSLLARLGSGSACRSIFPGFVEWHAGEKRSGLDSYATPIDIIWPDLRIGILTIGRDQKSISSRAGMERTVKTSGLYASWPEKTNGDLQKIKIAITKKDFVTFGKISESNALAMHATMLAAWPPLSYTKPETVAAMQHIWSLREAGLPLYFTQDAGPHLKLLFLAKESAAVTQAFPSLEVIAPFSTEEFS